MMGPPLDLLLVFPPTDLSGRYGVLRGIDFGGDLPPLGIAYIAAYLRQHGFAVGVLDGCVLKLGYDDVIEVVRQYHPKVVGLSSTTYALAASVALAAKLRAVFPDVLLILGGAHANATRAQALAASDEVDIVVWGEGEETSRELLQSYRAVDCDRARFLADSTRLAVIRGIAFRDGVQRVETPVRPNVELETLPYPARDLLPLDRYLPFPTHYRRRKLVHMVVSRGCPYACSFCDQANTRVRAVSPAAAVAEMAHVKERYGAQEVSFWDDNLTFNRKWIEEFCQRLLDARLGLIWSCYGTMRSMNPEILRLMKRSGCWNIFYGIETGDATVMKNILVDRKNKDLDHVRTVMRWTREASIEVRASFMLALPGETPAIAEKTIDFAIELDPDYAFFGVTTPYPGTPLYEQIRSGKWGKLLTTDTTDYQGFKPVFLPDGYSSVQQLAELKGRAYRRFYFRPAYFVRRMTRVRSVEDIKRNLIGVGLLLSGFARTSVDDRSPTGA